MGVFGSVARGEDRPDSDIDLLVHLPADATLVTLSRLRRALSDALGGEPVDVVPDDGLKPDVARSIQRDLIRL
ncbi:MAG: nucleotidyltransferase family protein [Motilibacteraceae bacterium]